MTHRYYSILKPIADGDYPKYRRNKPLKIVNFYEQELANVAHGVKKVWGYIEFAEPIRIEDVKKYELVKAPKHNYDRFFPREGEIWRHFKGNDYQVICIGEHTESKKPFVVYYRLSTPDKKHIRPLEMFMSEVDREKYPNATQEYRFERVSY